MRKKINITIIGEAGVGKTEFVNALLRYSGKDSPFNSVYAPTLGASYTTCQLSRLIQLDIWDTAGQERYWSLLPMYLRNPNFVFLVLDSQASAADSFRNMLKFYNTVRTGHASADFSSIMIMLSKTDLPSRTITVEQVSNFCHQESMEISHIIEISSKKMIGIEQVVQMVHAELKDDTELLKACEQMKITLQDYASARCRGKGASVAMFLKHPNRHWTQQIQTIVDRIHDDDLNTPQKIYEALDQSTSRRKKSGALEHIMQHFVSEYDLEVISHDEIPGGIIMSKRIK